MLQRELASSGGGSFTSRCGFKKIYKYSLIQGGLPASALLLAQPPYLEDLATATAVGRASPPRGCTLQTERLRWDNACHQLLIILRMKWVHQRFLFADLIVYVNMKYYSHGWY